MAARSGQRAKWDMGQLLFSPYLFTVPDRTERGERQALLGHRADGGCGVGGCCAFFSLVVWRGFSSSSFCLPAAPVPFLSLCAPLFWLFLLKESWKTAITLN